MKTIASILCCSLLMVLAQSATAQSKGDAAEATRQKSKASLTVKRDRATVEKRMEKRSAMTKQREKEAEKHKAPKQ